MHYISTHIMHYMSTPPREHGMHQFDATAAFGPSGTPRFPTVDIVSHLLRALRGQHQIYQQYYCCNTIAAEERLRVVGGEAPVYLIPCRCKNVAGVIHHQPPAIARQPVLVRNNS